MGTTVRIILEPAPALERGADIGIRWMLVVALLLAVVMSAVSNTQERTHPDEFDHIAAARYYEGNWLPPAVGDLRTLDSYSIYGMSYLNEWDVVYALAGKFAALARPLVHNESYVYQLFNLSLFAILVFLAWRKKEAMLLFSLLVVSAQIWYVFSYFNADAFPLFLSILAAYELASPRSAFNDQSRSLVIRYLRLGVYLGLLVLSKKTFWMFVVFGTLVQQYWKLGGRNALRSMDGSSA